MSAANRYPIIENPSTRFYWNDLFDEPGLKMSSLSAQGLWLNMLAIMAGAGGYLALEGFALTTQKLARYIGQQLEDVEKAVAELEENRVFSRDRHGTPYNRRMVKARKRADSNRENGKKGGRPKSLKSGDLFGNGTQKQTEPKPNHNPNGQPRARGLQDFQDSKTPEEKNHGGVGGARETPNVSLTPWHEVGRQVLTMLDVADDPRWAGNYALVEVWLKRGYDPERDIYPTITALMAKRNGHGPPGNLKYFDNAIARAHADRNRSIEEPAHVNGTSAKPRKPTYRERLQAIHDRSLARAGELVAERTDPLGPVIDND